MSVYEGYKSITFEASYERERGREQYVAQLEETVRKLRSRLPEEEDAPIDWRMVCASNNHNNWGLHAYRNPEEEMYW